MADGTNALSGHDNSQAEMMAESCILVDHNDKMMGAASKLVCHNGEGLLHRAFSVLIFDSENRLLIQQRSSEKITFPGIWANSCCSHPLDIEGENDDPVQGCINAARRKLPQELGISKERADSLVFVHLGAFQYKCRWNDEWLENEVDHVLITKVDSLDINPNENEISSYMWVDSEEISDIMEGSGKWEDELVAPWFRLLWMEFLEGDYPNLTGINKRVGVVKFGEVDIGSVVISPGSSLMAALKEHRETVEDEILMSLSKIKQERLHGAMTHLFTGGGKRLRAILPKLVGDAVGQSNAGHTTLGASIEIIHNFTLVHDDIMDQDPIRRGLDAVHVAYDDATAINAGDAMLAVAFEILAESDDIISDDLVFLVKSIGEMVRRVAEGQMIDMEFEKREHVSEDEYIEMIAGKTSAMFETCAMTGAKLSGATEQIVESMAEWGLNMGLCFQLMDDLIDITGDTETLGKPAGSDIVQGKRTLIAIHALGTGKELPSFREAYGSGECESELLAKAVQELHDNGSIQYAKDRAMFHHSKAHSCLDILGDSDSVSILREMTDFQLIRIN
tara:strand:+ start:20969 stop:22657 length:1689 start_codon:yes stop_codon:yes gene_type:complete